MTAVYARRYNARLRMRPRPDVEHAPLLERPEPLWWLPKTWRRELGGSNGAR